ncbi:MAG: HD domain-containing protein [Mycoplasma sp.]
MLINNCDIIRCTIHKNIIIFDKKIRDIIDTIEFQRLRRITQLGLGSFLYPSATHTRFAHSLGAYEIMRKLVTEYIGNDWTDYEKNLLMCTALLHDIGHGPLSHNFELISNQHHEDWTKKIILSKDTEIHHVIVKNFGADFLNDIIKLINKEYENKAFCKLISSELDVDRLDYLLRDSYYTNTGYGELNLEWILRCLKYEKSDLFITEKGIPSIENYLLARYFAYKQIYFHPKSLRTEQHFVQIITRLKDIVSLDFKLKNDYHLIEPLLNGKDIELNNYLKLDDFVFFTYINNLEEENDEVLKILVSTFKRHNFFVAEKFNHKIYAEKSKLLKEKFGDNYKYFITKGIPEINFYKNYCSEKENILIMTNTKDIKRIDEESKILGQLKSETDKVEMMFYYNEASYG